MKSHFILTFITDQKLEHRLRINNGRTTLNNDEAKKGMNLIISGNGFLTSRGILVAKKSCRRYDVKTIVFDVS